MLQRSNGARCTIPTYDYKCNKCGLVEEFRHQMSEEPEKIQHKCPECGHKFMERQFSSTFHVAQSYHVGPTMEDRKQQEHTKKVKDFDRAVRGRKKAFGVDAVGNPNDKPDPKHIIKKGRTLGGQQIEVDKAEFIKAAAKDDLMVNLAHNAIKKAEHKKKKK